MQQLLSFLFDWATALGKHGLDRCPADDLAHHAFGHHLYGDDLGILNVEQKLAGIIDSPKHRKGDIDDIFVAGQHQAFLKELTASTTPRRLGIGAKADIDPINGRNARPDHGLDWIGELEVEARRFTADELANPEKELTHWGANADLDSDGLCTLLEYLMNRDPHQHDTDGAIEAAFLHGQENLNLRYKKSKNASDGMLSTEASTDLRNWSRDGVTETVIANLGETWLVEAVVDASEAHRIFVRLYGELQNDEPLN